MVVVRRYRRFLSVFAVVFVVCSLGLSSEALSKPAKKASRRAAAKPYAALVVEADTGRILHEVKSTERRHPASLTKMMTLYLTFQALENKTFRLESPLSVSPNAAAQAPSKLGLRAGETIRVADAIMALITHSANDAAVVLAEAMGGTTGNFARMMVEQARALGMNHTVFRNPNGLPDPQQVTTARDMALLGHALIYHYPGYYGYFARTSFSYKGRTYNNHNHLMKRFDGMDGIKTGFINASGFNLVASAERGNKRLIGVIFGGRSAVSRDNALAALMDKAFEQVQLGTVKSAGYISWPGKTRTVFADSSQKSSKSAAMEKPSPEPRLTLQEQEEGTVEAESQGGAWGIQIGAFSSVDPAQKYLASMARIMAPLLANAEQSLQKVTMTDGSAVYRARFTGLDRQAARDACTYMIKHGQSCLVVSGP